MGAEQNHLCPSSAYSPPPRGSARVTLARTSLPPCFSVMAMPISAPCLRDAGWNEGSYSVEQMRGAHSRANLVLPQYGHGG